MGFLSLITVLLPFFFTKLNALNATNMVNMMKNGTAMGSSCTNGSMPFMDACYFVSRCYLLEHISTKPGLALAFLFAVLIF